MLSDKRRPSRPSATDTGRWRARLLGRETFVVVLCCALAACGREAAPGAAKAFDRDEGSRVDSPVPGGDPQPLASRSSDEADDAPSVGAGAAQTTDEVAAAPRDVDAEPEDSVPEPAAPRGSAGRRARPPPDCAMTPCYVAHSCARECGARPEVVGCCPCPRHLVDLTSCPRVPVERSIFDSL